MYNVTKLKNGLTIATAEMPHMTSVSLGLWVGVGGRYESAEVSGVCHFIEHMLFKGTRRRSARRISQDVEGVGGYLNAFTSEEMTCYHSKACHDRFGELLDVLSDMFLNSRFAPADITRERSVIKEELAMYLDQPQHRVQELLNELLWPHQPLGRALTGTEQTLDALTRAQLVNYQRSNYVANRVIFAAAGRLKHKQVVQAVSRLAARFPQGRRPQFAPAVSEQTQPRVHLFTKETEQTQLALGIRTCSRHDHRRFALRLLNTMLGENMSSRLFQVIREDRGLAYSIYSSLSYFDDVGTLTISAGLDLANLEKTLKLIMRELSVLAKSLPSEAELRRARDYVIGQIDLSLESTDSQMMWLGEQLIGYDKTIAPEEIKQHIREVRASEIRSVARDFFRPDRLNLALVSPLKSDQGLVKLLKVAH
ncbi:MAG TPA: pitrilysin family protein [Verrucomicrobiae bacterium]|jgi:predicted Zn-dependent peptidase|nr:pitrilysin family protein [Verrucomicrobiae bacterium]